MPNVAFSSFSFDFHRPLLSNLRRSPLWLFLFMAGKYAGGLAVFASGCKVRPSEAIQNGLVSGEYIAAPGLHAYLHIPLWAARRVCDTC
ncbi:hypothetical protein BDV29DRAFT_175957 [Aspergillus leporis]|uniref:Uncharacterized protein n=1 Tax=Aspergillus leporis TaxID=41062 RepID=A0A5N5X0Y4_9EURO|nr:hypothetical protein BDV29DRAFT_175957 [Aspergillus leporis]